MTIKMAMLKSGEDVIADIKEVIVKEKETNSDIQKPVLYVFDKPYIVKLTDPDVLMYGITETSTTRPPIDCVIVSGAT